MKTVLKIAFLTTSIVLTLTACNTKHDTAEEAQRIHASMQMESDELADAGEQLVSPYTFMLANKVFDMALVKDSGNKKAQFYRSFLKRLMVFKGIARRISPLINKGPQKQQDEFAKWQREFPESPLKTFLLDGPEDIHTYAQLVKVVADYNTALNDFRKFLKTNSTLELTLNLNPRIFESRVSIEAAGACSVIQKSDGSFEVSFDSSYLGQTRLNAADLIALRQYAGGEMLYWSLHTAYDLTTLEKIITDEQVKKMTEAEQLAYLKSQPNVATLNADHTLKLIPELGADFNAAVKWVKENYAHVCPRGIETPQQRSGYLFKDGLCAENASQIDKTLAMLDQVLGGVFTQPILNDQDQQIDQIRVNLVGFLNAPPQDLKNVLPASVDQDGKILSWTDNTFGGLFPDGDITKIPQRKN